MNLIIERLNGTQYSFADYGIKTLDFVIDSPEPRISTEEGEGLDGYIDLGATFGPRTMAGEFVLNAGTTDEFATARNAVFRLLMSRERFYLMDEREPNRRWLVRVSSRFSLEQIRHYGMFAVDFVSQSSYAESVSETTDTFTTKTFRLWNDGDVAIDPRQHRLKITFRGSSTDLRIQNVTTSDVWTFAGNSDIGRVIYLDGVRAMRNTTNIFRDTNRKLITLAPGFNDFIIGGTSGAFTIEFKYRSLYI
ncbi:phage tail domain-containing protein [Rossellomorea sp. FS2]|uniref:phage tail domain-containing protein n=1 Tax=Rossellomorea sp. FS2 TaxID=3391447 RepID=UPI003A4E0FDD